MTAEPRRTHLESAPRIDDGSLVLPSWCRSLPGNGPVLVIAPHGGLCARDLLAPPPQASLRGNDLHTAELAQLLAERLDASLLANVAADRNDVDLNRIDEVRARAPWFLDAIGAHLERIVARHGRATVLIVHGWQIVQPRCDVGIGARLASARDAQAHATRLTVSPEFVTGTLEALRAATASRGVETSYGIRWPARHANNVMQLFRRDTGSADGDAHRLPALAARGHVEAVQLELAAPLRYPGAWRDRFLDAAAAAFACRAGGTSTTAVVRSGRDGAHPCEEPGSARIADPVARTPTPAVALQAVDTTAGTEPLGIVVGLGAISPRELGARLLLFPGGQRMLLFTGHERIAAGANDRVGGLEARACPRGLAVRFRGPVLDVPDASRHFREEAAQLEARVVELELDLQFVAHGEAGYGAVQGAIRSGATTWRVAAHGFTAPVLARPATATGSLRVTAAFGDALGIVADLAAPAQADRLQCLTPHGTREHAVVHTEIPQAIMPGRLAPAFVLDTRGGPKLRCTPLGHVSILRPGANGRVLHVTFGAARFELDGGERGAGFYEHGAPAGPAGAAAGQGGGDDDDRSAQ